MPKSSAAKAGIKAGDVIVTMNGKAISSFASFRAEIGTLPVGSKMSLGIIRDGKPVTIDVTLEQSAQTRGLGQYLHRHRRRRAEQYPGWQREGRQGRQRESRQRRGAHRPEKGDVIPA